MILDDISLCTNIYEQFDTLPPPAQRLVIAIYKQFPQLSDEAQLQVIASLEFRRLKDDLNELAYDQVGIVGSPPPGWLEEPDRDTHL